MNQQIDEMTNDSSVINMLKQTAKNYDLSLDIVRSAWFMKQNSMDFYERLENEVSHRKND